MILLRSFSFILGSMPRTTNGQEGEVIHLPRVLVNHTARHPPTISTEKSADDNTTSSESSQIPGCRGGSKPKATHDSSEPSCNKGRSQSTGDPDQSSTGN
jgi:hypothetical protein